MALNEILGTKSWAKSWLSFSLFSADDMQKQPLARTTISDSLSSTLRQTIVTQTQRVIVRQAREILPDRLAEILGLGSRAVYALDGTYQKERTRSLFQSKNARMNIPSRA